MQLGHDPLINYRARSIIDQALEHISYSYLENITSLDLDAAWRHWLEKSSFNTIVGLESLQYSCFCAGTTPAFGEFISRYPNARIRNSRSDFIITKILSSSYHRELVFLEDDVLRKGDILIISLPFSGNGGVYPNFDSILNAADDLDIPVFLDGAYFGIAHGIHYPLTRHCIKDFAVSLSKNFAGRELRLGMRFTRDLIDDGISAANVGFKMFDKLGAYLSIQLLEQYSHDDFIIYYKSISDEICKDLNLTPTNVVTLALGNETMADQFKRGDYIRVCISEELSRTSFTN